MRHALRYVSRAILGLALVLANHGLIAFSVQTVALGFIIWMVYEPRATDDAGEAS